MPCLPPQPRLCLAAPRVTARTEARSIRLFTYHPPLRVPWAFPPLPSVPWAASSILGLLSPVDRPPLLGWAGEGALQPEGASDGGFSGSFLSQGDTSFTGSSTRPRASESGKLSPCVSPSHSLVTPEQRVSGHWKGRKAKAAGRLCWPLTCRCLCLSLLPFRPTRRWRQELPPDNSAHMGTGNLSKVREQSLSNPLSQKQYPARAPSLPTLELLLKMPLRALPNVCLPPNLLFSSW